MAINFIQTKIWGILGVFAIVNLVATIGGSHRLIAQQPTGEVREVVLTPDDYGLRKKTIEALCDDCSSSDLPSTLRALLVIADFQPTPTEPCATPKATIAAVQQWAIFDLLDVVQKDVRFGSVFVTDKSHVFRPMEPVLPTDRAAIRRKLMQAQPRSGGSVSDGLEKGIQLLSSIPVLPNQNRHLSLVLMLSRYPTDVEAIKKSIEPIKSSTDIYKFSTEIHILATVVNSTTEEKLRGLAVELGATFGAAQWDRELPGEMVNVFQQLNAFDQNYLEELTAIKAAFTKCCKEKNAICKLIDGGTGNNCDFGEIIALIREESMKLEERLIIIERKPPPPCPDVDLGPLMDEINNLKIEIRTLIENLEKQIKISITMMGDKLDSHLTIIEKKIENIKISESTNPNTDIVAVAVYNKLFGWFWFLSFLLLLAIGCVLFTAIISRKIHKRVHYSKSDGMGSGGGAGYGGTLPTNPTAY